MKTSFSRCKKEVGLDGEIRKVNLVAHYVLGGGAMNITATDLAVADFGGAAGARFEGGNLHRFVFCTSLGGKKNRLHCSLPNLMGSSSIHVRISDAKYNRIFSPKSI